MKKTKKKTAKTARRASAKAAPTKAKSSRPIAKKTSARTGAPRKRPASRAPQANAEDMDLESIERLVQLMAENDLLEIEVRNGPDRKVRLSRRSDTQQSYVMPASAPTPAASAPTPTPAAAAPTTAPTSVDTIEFVSPMVGTFYRAPSPESPPYVNIGEKVNPESILCIIEAMKVMNEIKAEVSGEVVDILVENGEAVEFGQPLFLIKKSG